MRLIIFSGVILFAWQGACSAQDMLELVPVAEKFYAALDSQDRGIVAQYAIPSVPPYKAPDGKAKACVFGEAFGRSRGMPCTFKYMWTVVDQDSLAASFEKITGTKLKAFIPLAVSYPYDPQKYPGIIFPPFVERWSVDESYLDVWLQGVDGMWRVATGFRPWGKLDSQSLSLSVVFDEAKADAEYKRFMDINKEMTEKRIKLLHDKAAVKKEPRIPL